MVWSGVSLWLWLAFPWCIITLTIFYIPNNFELAYLLINYIWAHNPHYGYIYLKTSSIINIINLSEKGKLLEWNKLLVASNHPDGNTVCLLSRFSHVWLFAKVWSIACQAPLSMGFSRQEYCRGLLRPPLGDLPDPWMEPVSHDSCIGKHVLYHWCHLGSPIVTLILANTWRYSGTKFIIKGHG